MSAPPPSNKTRTPHSKHQQNAVQPPSMVGYALGSSIIALQGPKTYTLDPNVNYVVFPSAENKVFHFHPFVNKDKKTRADWEYENNKTAEGLSADDSFTMHDLTLFKLYIPKDSRQASLQNQYNRNQAKAARLIKQMEKLEKQLKSSGVQSTQSTQSETQPTPPVPPAQVN